MEDEYFHGKGLNNAVNQSRLRSSGVMGIKSGIFRLFLVSMVLFLGFVGSASAVTGGPDSFGYEFIDSNTPDGPTYDWIEISGTGTEVLSNSDDSVADNIDLGFFFNYYGTDYSRLAIANNGLLFSVGTTSQFVNEPITQTAGVHGFIAPFWDDLVTWRSGAIYYQTFGTSPNRMFVVQWNDNEHYSSSTSGITFEAILYEGSNNIKFLYKDVDFGTGGDNPPYNNGGSATVGIEDPTGDVGLQYSFNEQVIDPGLAILFEFPQFAGTNLYLSKQAPASKDNGSTMTYSLYYHNFGDTAAQNVVLEDTLPAEVEFVSASDSGSYDSSTGKVTWNIGGLEPSGNGYRTVTVRILQSVSIGTVIQNDATINTSTLEVRYDDNEAHAQTSVTGSSLPPDVGVEPNNGGATPSVVWHIPITFTYYSSCATGVGINIHINDGGPDITGTMVEISPDTWTYTASFNRTGSATITYTVSGCATSNVTFNIYIDRAGYIYDVDTGERIENATVWLQRPDGMGDWENAPTGEAIPVAQPDVNPLITGIDGQYQWDVLAGSYRVHVEASGYYPEDSIVVSIPPPVTDLHVGLTSIPTTTTTSTTTTTLPSQTTVTIDNAVAPPMRNTTVSMTIENVLDIGVADITLAYNRSVVQVLNATSGDFDFMDAAIDNANGITRTGTMQTTNPGLNGSVTLANITLKAVGGIGECSTLNLSINELKTVGPPEADISATVVNGLFCINETTPPSVTNPSAHPQSIPEDTDNNPTCIGTPYSEVSHLNVMVTDASGVLSVTANLSAIGGLHDQPMTNISDTWTVTINASIGSAIYNGTDYLPHYLLVNATDIYDNSNSSVGVPLTVIKNGDVNEDGNTTLYDAMYLARNVLGKPGFETITPGVAEVSGDCSKTIYDAMYLAKNVLGKPGFGTLR